MQVLFEWLELCRYRNMALRRHPEHMCEFYEWAPGTLGYIVVFNVV
jgi:hypothetical protein